MRITPDSRPTKLILKSWLIIFVIGSAPSDGRFRRTWKIASIALAVILVVAIAGILGLASWNNGELWTPQGPSMVEISTITLDIQYLGNQSGYLGPVEQNECSQCPINLEEGSRATLTVLRLEFSTSGPPTVWITWTINSTYPFYEVGYLLPNPPLMTSQTDYNVSYLAGSALTIGPTLEVPSPLSHPSSMGSIEIHVVSSQSPLPDS